MYSLALAFGVPLLLVVVLIVGTSVNLLRNYASARRVGVPIRIIPISPLNPFWALIDRSVLSYLRNLPFGNNSFTRYNWRGWEVKDRWQSHEQMGDLWILVTPFKNWIYVNDPETLTNILRRANDFPRPVFMNEMLDVFGPNISTAEGTRWKTQRKIATRCFNEQNNGIVWSESITLASDMIKYWVSKGAITSTADDLRTLSLHVLSRAGFGKSFKFEGHDERQGKETASGNYKESLQTILENLVLILGLGLNLLGSSWLPTKFQNVNKACVSFQKHMTDLYEEEKRRLRQGRDGDPNLMTGLIRSSQEDADGLTEKEVYGNMFTFNFAGHDTTAHTFTFAMFFLAANPHVQDWMSEEIRFVFGDKKPEDWEYRAGYPRLKRCLAVMYETLRLYTIVPAIKWTASQEQEITVRGKRFILPPQSMVAPSYGAVQTDPRFWGDDPLTWKPSRWIKTTSGLADEEFIHPEKGTFVAWSEGPRDCPGRKFSQVEFVATMAVLFLNWRVEPLPSQGESIHAARRRLLDMIENDSGYVLLLQMLHPERASLRWKKDQM